VRLIIQKFGGSSLCSHKMRELVKEHILAAKHDGYQPVVVVSAMGRKGEPYATDTFLDMIRNVSPMASPREIDLLISCGELMAAAVLAAQINGTGAEAVALTGWQAGIITDGVFGHAEILRIKKERILKLASAGIIVVVAGFQGISENCEVNTLGRGGSDTTAVALAAALESERVEIYSDVDSVMTADPRLVPEAKPIQNIGYQEVLLMSREGAKVIHPRAVDIALQYNLPLLFKKTGEYNGGTLVTHKKICDEKGYISREKVISGITHVEGLAQVRLADPQAKDIEEILRKQSSSGISFELISFSPQEKIFTVPATEAQRVADAFNAAGCPAEVRAGFAKVSVVRSGMRGNSGVMVRVVRALNQVGTEILQTVDSHISISCLIPQKDVANAVKSLHLEFCLGEEA